MEIHDRPLRERLLGFRHYYGDNVRRLFLVSAAIMLLTYPMVGNGISTTPSLSVFTVLLLIFMAGLTNPREPWVRVANAVIAGGGTLVFGYYASLFYSGQATGIGFFFVNQVLAALFLVAFYYAVKTVRGTRNEDVS